MSFSAWTHLPVNAASSRRPRVSDVCDAEVEELAYILVPSLRRLTDYGWPSHDGDCRPLVWNWLRFERTCVNIMPFVYIYFSHGQR